jgi:hypothetical protein
MPEVGPDTVVNELAIVAVLKKQFCAIFLKFVGIVSREFVVCFFGIIG